MKEAFLKYMIEHMSLAQKIGQMIMIDYRNTLEMNSEFESILGKYNPGGFILFHSNVENWGQTYNLIKDIKEIGTIKPIVSVDQEGGLVQRLDERVGIKIYEPMLEIAKKQDIYVYSVGKKMGHELNLIGIDMDTAPVLDIWSNPENKVIGNRAFGIDSETVKRKALLFAAGLQKSHIIPVGKHFPGHGDTTKDSHIDLPVVTKSLEELKQRELIPFAEAVKQELPALMVAHIAVPNITNDNTPASLSKVMINDLLRKDMGYKGLIMPDSLKMKALTNYYSPEEIYLAALEAGNDILLMPRDIVVAYNTIYQAVDSGKIPISRIDESVFRILSLKFDHGFLNKDFANYVLSHYNDEIGGKIKVQ